MSIRHLTTFGLLFAALAGCEPRPADTTGGGLGGPEAVEQDEAARGDRPVEPDNTARNAQDRRDAAKTPFDQAENGSDIATTAAIRREILKTEGLSTNADNVKIITANGMVTLRGVVNSDAERETVKAIAVRIAGAPDKVDSQLEINPDGDEGKVEDKADDGLDEPGAEREGDLRDDARPGEVRDPMDDAGR